MANFDKAFTLVVGVEGGYVNHPADKGGPTNWGITQGTLSGYLGRAATVDDVKNLSLNTAKLIYKKNYWDKMNLDSLTDETVAYIMFDQGVNRGTTTQVKELQGVLNRDFDAGIAVDGDLGPKTLAAIGEVPSLMLANKLIQNAQDDYVDIVKRKPSQIVFLAGWINRSQKLMDKMVTSVKHVGEAVKDPLPADQQDNLTGLERLFAEIIEAITEVFNPKPVEEPESPTTPQEPSRPTTMYRNKAALLRAAQDIGVKEIAGSANNPKITEFLRYSNLENDARLNEATAWCSGVMCYWLEMVGMGSTNALNARSYLGWGVSTKDDPLPGDIVVFWRESRAGWKGHVTILVKKSGKYLYCLGGNQANAVNVTKYDTSKLLDIRRSSKHEPITVAMRAELARIGEDILNGNKVEPPGSVV